MSLPTSDKVVNFFRGEVAPGKLDEIMSIMRAVCARNADEPLTRIQAYHFEPPNVIWVYALFETAEALEEHRRINNADPQFHRIMSCFSSYEQTHETVPLFAKGIDFDDAALP